MSTIPVATGQTIHLKKSDDGKIVGGKFDFDDGGSFCGGWADGKAHGHGICTGPKNQGEFAGSFHYGFEVSGTYISQKGSLYEGEWQDGKRHGMGMETRGNWVYKGEWHFGSRGRYGVRISLSSAAKYEGTWSAELQDGYGTETYADTGYYKGQWLKGMRNAYGVRKSAPFGMVCRTVGGNGSSTSLRGYGEADRDTKINAGSGGFVLNAKSDEGPRRRGSLVERSGLKGVFRMRRQRSTGDIGSGKHPHIGSIRSSGSQNSCISGADHEGSNTSFLVEDAATVDPTVYETYYGEWRNDKRCGYGISERTDGLKYCGEWFNNKKYGYGITTFKDGTIEEGKYKNNVLVTSNKKKHNFLIKSSKFRERIDAAEMSAQNASQKAEQKEDIANSRTATARDRSETAEIAAYHAKENAAMARQGRLEFMDEKQREGEEPSQGSKRRSVSKAPPDEFSRGRDQSSFVEHNFEPTQQFSSLPSTSGYSNSRINDFQLPLENSGRRPSASSDNFNRFSSGSTTGLSRTERGRSAQKSTGTRSKPISNDPGFSNIPSNILNDRFDHYNRPSSRAASRDRSIDRFASRGTTPTAEIPTVRSRAPSQHKYTAPDCTPDSGVFEDISPSTVVSNSSSRRASRPINNLTEGVSLTGNGSIGGSFNIPYHIPSNQHEAENLLKQRVCGQTIPPPNMGSSLNRTESLYINPVIRQQQQPKPAPAANPVLRRKKSLPDDKPLPVAHLMPREEAAALGSAQRHANIHRAEERDRYRQNPLLYLNIEPIQIWISNHQLFVVLLIINSLLTFMFYKLLS